MIGFLFAVAIQTAPALPGTEPWARDPIVQLAPPWHELEIGQWAYLGASNSNQTVTFLRPGPRRGLVWARYEYRESLRGSAVRSSRALNDIDCGEWKTRRMQLVSFDGPNLTGAQVEQLGQGVWDYAAPDTVAEAILKYGCGD